MDHRPAFQTHAHHAEQCSHSQKREDALGLARVKQVSDERPELHQGEVPDGLRFDVKNREEPVWMPKQDQPAQNETGDK